MDNGTVSRSAVIYGIFSLAVLVVWIDVCAYGLISLNSTRKLEIGVGIALALFVGLAFVPNGTLSYYRILLRIVNIFLKRSKPKDNKITAATQESGPPPQQQESDPPPQNNGDIDPLVEKLVSQYAVTDPLYHFEQLAVSQNLMDELLLTIDTGEAEEHVLDEGQRAAAASFPHIALHFYGPPGTGKTLASHALADHLGKRILVTNYSNIYDKYIVDNGRSETVKAIFTQAAREDAILLIDEADSLLSSLSAMTISDQVRFCMKKFQIIVIFTTNIIESYNKLLEGRVRHIYFPLPDKECRATIWKANLPDTLLLAADVSPDTLAEQTAGVCGRDISIAVIDAAKRAKKENKSQIELKDLLEAVKRIQKAPVKDDIEISVEARARQYEARPPLHPFEKLIVPQSLMDDLLLAVSIVELEEQVFDKWGLRAIEPFPCTALNFYGPPGTGKTLAAHALADHLKRPILAASYAEIESKWLADGSKNANAIFYAAAREHAVLFIDEADSLLAKRLTSVSNAADHSINILSNQMLICLENFRGVVIFATNMIQNYDRAFETRVRQIHFPMPDEDCRRRIWEWNLPAALPRAADISPAVLAAQFKDICGRDIKNAVINAALKTAMEKKPQLELNDLLLEIKRIKNARVSQSQSGEHTHVSIPLDYEILEAKVRQSLNTNATNHHTPSFTDAGIDQMA